MQRQSRGDYHKNNYGGRGPHPQGRAGRAMAALPAEEETSGPLYGRIDINRNKDGE
ncbi:MAG: hypothetical protein ACLS8R_03520 [Anaeromassilibacillus sp.]